MQAVSASISTPVRAVVRASAGEGDRSARRGRSRPRRRRTRAAADARAGSARRCAWPPGCRRSGPCRARRPWARRPARRSPPSPGLMRTTARARARRSLSRLSPTSTMRARPARRDGSVAARRPPGNRIGWWADGASGGGGRLRAHRADFSPQETEKSATVRGAGTAASAVSVGSFIRLSGAGVTRSHRRAAHGHFALDQPMGQLRDAGCRVGAGRKRRWRRSQQRSPRAARSRPAMRRTRGALRVVKAGKRCKRGERKIAWTTNGVRGTRGVRGVAEAVRGRQVATELVGRRVHAGATGTRGHMDRLGVDAELMEPHAPMRRSTTSVTTTSLRERAA